MRMPIKNWKEGADGFRTDVQEAPPTSDQLSSILDYLGPSKAGTVVKDATGSSDALRKFKADANSFQRPVVVDWNNGRAGRFTISWLSAIFGMYTMLMARQLLETTRVRS
jgi:hypothetical protein